MSGIPLYAETQPETRRGLTAALWGRSLQEYVSNDPRFGVRLRDDFDGYRVASGTGTPVVNEGWSVDREAGNADGTVSFDSVAGPDGVVRLNSTSTTNHGGATAQKLNPAVTLPTHGVEASRRGRVVAEFRVDFSDADTAFVGLSEAGDQFLTATSALPADQDYIGFYTDDNGATLSFVTANDNNGGAAVTDSFSVPTSWLNESGYNKIGFAVNLDSSVDVVVNGNWAGKVRNGIAASALPIETLTPRLSATAGGGTTAPTLDVDTYDVFVAGV